MKDAASHLSPLELDLLKVGGLSPRDQAQIAEHLAGCEACRGRQAEVEEETQAFHREVLPRLLARQQRPTRRPLLLTALAAGGALAGLVLVRLVPRSRPDPDVGIKGRPSLRVIARRGDEIFEVFDGHPLVPGDALRFVVTAPPEHYMLVVSVDGAGRASVYHPYRGSASGPVDVGRPLEVPAGSIVLDRAPGPERVFAIFSREPLDSGPIIALLEALGQQGHEAIRRQTELFLPGTLQMSLCFEKLVTP